MSSIPSKRLFDIIGGRHERNKRAFSSLDLFSLTFRNSFSGPLIGAADHPHRTPLGQPLHASCYMPRWCRTRVRYNAASILHGSSVAHGLVNTIAYYEKSMHGL